jgi:hypothetical protein
MSISFPPEGDQKSPSLRSGFWRANNVGSFFMPKPIRPQGVGRLPQARKDKQALGLRPSLHQCLLVWKEASEASPGPGPDEARKDKQAMKVSPLTFIACLSFYGKCLIIKTH